MTAELAALRARVAELEAERAGVDDFRLMLAKLVHRLRQRPDLPAKEMIEQAADLLARKGGASILRSTPDPRDARIAELETALREIRSKSGDQWSIDAADRALGDAHG